jgi:hypothetical protein
MESEKLDGQSKIKQLILVILSSIENNKKITLFQNATSFNLVTIKFYVVQN